MSPVGRCRKQDLESAWNLESQTVLELFFATTVKQKKKINKTIETTKIKENTNKPQYYANQTQQPMSRSMPTTLYSCHFVFIGLYLDRISREWDSRGSAMTSHKKLTDVTAAMNRNCLSFTKEKLY